MQGRRLTLKELSATSNMSWKGFSTRCQKSGKSQACPRKVPHNFHDDQKKSMWKSASKLLFL